ncbi:MAG: phenylalanine--tRNA ligase subunit alpha [Myxococcota bacterium]
MDTGAIEQLKIESEGRIKAVSDLKALEEVKNDLFSKKRGKITALMNKMREIPPDRKPAFGKLVNELRDYLQSLLDAKTEELKSAEFDKRIAEEKIDVTLPGRRPLRGGLHPLQSTMQDILDIFSRMGFSIRRGPEAETDWYNFEALNFPPDHPAREMQATIFLEGGFLLRTHTSPVQIRTMESEPPPVQIVAPGVVYRHDDDITHSPMFMQVEGLLVDKGITFADLKGSLIHFLRELFGEKTQVRFRPSFFPFTEPSAEVDIRCVACGGRGCRICKGSGWLEILGSGMVDPAVFEAVNKKRGDNLYDPERISGYAFGIGVERVTMLRYNIGDIRLFYQNDVRFLAQFGG